MSVVEVVDEAGYRALLASERLAVLHFWADFAAECRTVTAVLTELGTGVGLGSLQKIEFSPQSKELVRGPPELVEHFRL